MDRDAPRWSGRATRPAIRTIVTIFRYLRAFTEWLTQRPLRVAAAVTELASAI